MPSFSRFHSTSTSDYTATDVQPVMAEARTCALTMLENVTYIERELPNVTLADDLRAQTTELCSNLIGTKHDIFTELFELDELRSAPTTESAVLAVRVERIVRWLREELPKRP